MTTVTGCRTACLFFSCNVFVFRHRFVSSKHRRISSSAESISSSKREIIQLCNLSLFLEFLNNTWPCLCLTQSTSSFLCSTILDVISSIYQQDNANYFLLEEQSTLPQFIESLPSKPRQVQVTFLFQFVSWTCQGIRLRCFQTKFFEVLEFIVFNLNYVPFKEFVAISILLKGNQ